MKFRIKEEREKKGMTQTDLIEKSGVSRRIVCELESGKRDITTTGTLNKIAKTLDIPVSKLIE